MSGRSLTLTIFGEDKSAASTVKKVGDEVEGTGKKIGTFGQAAKGALAGFGVAAAGAAIKDFAKESVEAFVEASQSSLELQNAFDKFPSIADSSVESITEIAEALALKTRYDDDATKSAAATAAQFGLTGKQIEQAIPLIQDYAAKTGKDLSSAAEIVGKALGGNAKGLKDVGILYKSTGDKGEDFTNVMGLLNQQVGGFAEKDGAGAAGQAEILGNQFGEVKESVGEALLPVLMTLGQWLISTGIPALQGMAGWVSENSGWLLKAGGAVLGLWAAFKGYSILTGVITAVRALGVAFTANPIGLIIAAVAALVAGFIYLWNTSDGFRNFFLEMWEVIKTVVGTYIELIVSIVQIAWDFISNIFTTVWTAISTFFTGIWDGLSATVTRVWNAITAFITTAFEVVAGIIRGVWNGIVAFLSAIWDGISSAASAVWNGISSAISGIVTGIGSTISSIWNGISSFLSGVWNGISSVAGSVWNGIRSAIIDPIAGAWSWIQETLGGIAGWFGDKFGAVKTAIVSAFTGVKDTIAGIFSGVKGVVSGIINSIIGVLNKIVGGLNIVIRGVNYIPGVEISPIPMIPNVQLAKGGVVLSSTFAEIGEGSEPEAVLPLSKLDGMLANAGGGGGNNGVTIVLPPGFLIGTADELARKLGEIVAGARRRGTVKEGLFG